MGPEAAGCLTVLLGVAIAIGIGLKLWESIVWASRAVSADVNNHHGPVIVAHDITAAAIGFMFWALFITLAAVIGRGVVHDLMAGAGSPGCAQAMLAMVIFSTYAVLIALLFAYIDEAVFGPDPLGLGVPVESGADGLMEVFMGERLA